MNKRINKRLIQTFKVVIATTNIGKIAEIRAILNQLAALKFELSSLKDYTAQEPDEPFETCLENAIHKAKYYSAITQLPTLSEDAGLYIEALNGFPGVRTKDFAVQQGDMLTAFDTLHSELLQQENKRAFFKCAAVICFPDTEEILSFEADTYGTLCFPPRGKAGFGFDPIFIPDGYTHTMAELGEEVKNKISHRALALNGLVDQLSEYFSASDAKYF